MIVPNLILFKPLLAILQRAMQTNLASTFICTLGSFSVNLSSALFNATNSDWSHGNIPAKTYRKVTFKLKDWFSVRFFVFFTCFNLIISDRSLQIYLKKEISFTIGLASSNPGKGFTGWLT